MLRKLKRDIRNSANPMIAKNLMRFFKTGIGQYGEGDVFVGLKMEQQREICKRYWDKVDSQDIKVLIDSGIHEERMIGFLILVEKFKKGDEELRKKIYNFYLKNTARVNNWDLVDLSAHKIIGEFLVDKDRSVLYELARSDNLWERRIAIISCFAFIRQGDFKDALKISEVLLGDSHDLIHKAVGWMLREVGKRDQSVLEEWLQEGGRYKKMPRTMLRYSIERFSKGLRKNYLLGKV